MWHDAVYHLGFWVLVALGFECSYWLFSRMIYLAYSKIYLLQLYWWAILFIFLMLGPAEQIRGKLGFCSFAVVVFMHHMLSDPGNTEIP